MNLNNRQSLMENTLAPFFRESSLFCGAEKSLHTFYCHYLSMNGVNARHLSREYPPANVVLHGAQSLLTDRVSLLSPKTKPTAKRGAGSAPNALDHGWFAPERVSPGFATNSGRKPGWRIYLR